MVITFAKFNFPVFVVTVERPFDATTLITLAPLASFRLILPAPVFNAVRFVTSVLRSIPFWAVALSDVAVILFAAPFPSMIAPDADLSVAVPFLAFTFMTLRSPFADTVTAPFCVLTSARVRPYVSLNTISPAVVVAVKKPASFPLPILMPEDAPRNNIGDMMRALPLCLMALPARRVVSDDAIVPAF